ncbi:MAG: hypothetical protein M3R27_15080 [Bacteroidota bacterium]|nr:hypothetical protein [Bacteroidota bacterium]
MSRFVSLKKNLLFPFFFLTGLFLSACSGEEPRTSNQPTPEADSVSIPFDASVMQGSWVMTDYIMAIERTKSPLKSSDKLTEVVSMYIDIKKLKDSLEIAASWNNHEGYSFMIYSKKGQLNNSLPVSIKDYDVETNFYELGYELIQDDTFLFIYHYNSAKKLLDKKQFSQIPMTSGNNDLSDGLQFIVNQQLISGNYYPIDHPDQTIEFKSDGSVKGFKGFTNYDVWTDFIAWGDEELRDGLCFDREMENSECFRFKISADTLFLSEGKSKFILIKE